MKLLSVVGARPQFIKLAPVQRAVVGAGHEHIIVHTGQHYDHDMSDVFFEGLDIPSPDVNLSVGSMTHGAQTAAMLKGLEAEFISCQPDWVIVYGDTNSTLAASIAAAKLHIRVAHVEAGLRSFNRQMPEEHNRVLTDHSADLLLAPTAVAMSHLEREGLGERSRLIGDVMVDVFRLVEEAPSTFALTATQISSGLTSSFYLATVHRQESTDDPEHLRRLIAGLGSLDKPVVLPAHPRLVRRAAEAGIELAKGAIRLRGPLSYREMVAALRLCDGVVTDSGGLQKEAFLAGRMCTTLRTETEWVETLAGGWNVLVADLAELAEAVARTTPTAPRSEPFGDGCAARRIVAELDSIG